MRKKCYYHLTSFKSFLVIKEEGIKADNEGYIYLLDTQDYNNYVASNQLGLPDYAVFEVNSDGITSILEPDNIGELTAKHQFRIKQPLIDKKYLKFLDIYHTQPIPSYGEMFVEPDQS